MYIASISSDLKIHVWPNGQLVHTYRTSLKGSIKSISWSKDGSWLVVVPHKGHAEIISVRDSLKHLHSIQDIQQPTCATFQTTTKRNIALGTVTGSVLIYDIKTKNIRKHFPRAPSTIFKVEYCAKDNFLAAGCDNGEILLYNGVTYNLSASYKIPNTKTITALSCHTSKRNLISAGSQEGIVGVWDIHTNKLIYHEQAHAAPITDLTFSPIRNDLIVTTGFDRKLAFFDLSKRCCSLQKILDRSATAIDFCPDNIGIAVALQDGTIQAYDTRQLNDPLYSFKSHNFQIGQVAFQKSGQENTSDYTFQHECNDSGEEVISPRTPAASNRSFDSFGHMFCGDVLPDIPEVPTDYSDMDAGDSFIDAIGLNSNNAPANSPRESLPGVTEGIKRLSDSKLSMLANMSHNSPLFKMERNINFPDVQRRTSESFLQGKNLASLHSPMDGIKADKASTPRYSTQECDQQMYISPIPVGASNSASVTNINTTELQKIIRDVVKQEIKGEIQSFQQELKYEFMDVIAQIRRHFLDLQMSIVKEFVQMESSISKIKEESLTEDGYGDGCLIQENLKLRKELAALRDPPLSNNTDD